MSLKIYVYRQRYMGISFEIGIELYASIIKTSTDYLKGWCGECKETIKFRLLN